jgi:hypothetical protein
MEDVVARVIALAGLVIALASIGVNWYLWHRAGPELRVTAFARAESGTLHIEVANSGRLPTTVRRIELRDYFVLWTTGGY